jgi:hypothetical protein
MASINKINGQDIYAASATFAATAGAATSSISASYAATASLLIGTASWATNVVNNGVTSVATAGTVSGITLTGGTITSTGTITLGGSISGLTNSNLSGTAGITNANLANSSVTVGSTAISLGGTSTTLAGLTNVTSTNFTGSLQGTASLATTATSASTQTISTNALHYPVFVDANNASPAAEKLGTGANFNFNPSTNRLDITGSLGVTAGITGSFTGSMFGRLTGTGSFTGSLTGSMFGTASWASNAITASVITITLGSSDSAPQPILFAPNSGSQGVRADVGVFSYSAIGDQLLVPNISSSGAILAGRIATNFITGSVTLSGSLQTSGSFRGEVNALTITSQTASVNLDRGNMYTLTLANNVTTHIAFTNIRPGQTANIRVTQGSSGNGAVAFQSVVKQPTGSAYTGSQVANAIDILSLVTFDSTDVYVSSVRRLL